MVVVMADALCQTELQIASVVNGKTGKHVDNVNIVNENQSLKEYDWDDTNSWGGD